MEQNEYYIEQVTSPSQELVETFNQLMQELNPSLLPIDHDSLKKIVSASDTYLFVARETLTNKVIGTLTLITYQLLSGARGSIQDVVVDKNYRGRGVGSLLMKEGISQAKKLQLRYIELSSRPEREAANKMYQRLGFERRDTNLYKMKL